MIRPLALVCVMTGAAAADPFCAELETFAAAGTPPELGQFEPPDCGVARVLGGANSVHCAWTFDLRAPRAGVAFEDMADKIEGCGAQQLVLETSQVNHPDSYAQREYSMNGLRLSLSLKDKGGLGQTLIFLRAVAE